MTTPTTLYRFFDERDQLLYVGIAGNPGRRFDQHAKGPDGKPWWPQVVRSTMEHFDTREEAAAAEVAAIMTEGPLHNVVHNRVCRPARPPGWVTYWCVECHQEIQDGAGYVQVNVHAAQRVVRIADRGGPGWPDEWSAVVAEAGPRALGWHAIHRSCDPDTGNGWYWMAVERVRSNEALVDFEAHVKGKRWWSVTDLEEWVETCFSPGHVPTRSRPSWSASSVDNLGTTL